MKLKYLALSAAFISAPAFAQEHKDHHAAEDHSMHHDGHDHNQSDHASHEANASTPSQNSTLSSTPAIEAALAKGGDAAIVNVLGVVCDFCAKAMNKTFGKREEVEAVYVDLDHKTLNLVFKKDQALNDEDIEKLVKKAGYRISNIMYIPSTSGAS